jgi:RimJ/RimL family protein N-acetyltransferase
MEIYLETDRLILRRLTDADAENLFELDGDPAVMRFINGGRPTPREVSRRRCSRGCGLGYRLRRSAWGKGHATEGSQAPSTKASPSSARGGSLRPR